MLTPVHADLPTLVVDFLNTLDLGGRRDLLDRPGAWAGWARDREFVAGDPIRARAARDALRELFVGAAGEHVEGVAAALPPVSLTLAAGPAGSFRLVPAEPDATAAVLAAVATLAARGSLDRLKLCAAADCRSAFHDRSKNRSRAWCSMAVCGNRAKARAFRARG